MGGITIFPHNGSLQSMVPSFERFTRRIMYSVVLAAVVVFAVATYDRLGPQAAKRITEQARLCAVVLQAAPDGEMAASAKVLLDQYDQLLAVATINTLNKPGTLYPEDISLRAALTEAVTNQSGPTRTSATLADQDLQLWGVRVPFHADNPDTSREVGFLFRAEPVLGPWLWLMGGFGAFVCATVGLGLLCMNRWFERQVVTPLRRLSKSWKGDTWNGGRLNGLPPATWREIEEITNSLRLMSEKVAESQSRVQRVEKASRSLIHKSETMFNRKLRRAKDQATTDPLTGLRNRRFIEEEFGPLFDQQRRRGQDLSIVMLDLDNFKHLNDTRGHKAGDELLRFAGALVRGAIRPQDFAVRYGGDEFVLFLPDARVEEAQSVAKRVVALFAQYTSSVLNCEKPLTLSAGVASLMNNPYCETGGSLLAQADEALYKVKEAGKNAVMTAQTV